MTDDFWSSLSKRDAGVDEERARLAKRPDMADPFSTALLFFQALVDHVEFLNALENLITPESREAWGDFEVAAALLASIEDWGLGDKPTLAVGDPHVAYAKVLRGVTQPFEVLEEQVISAAAVITLVWRPELGMWRVHAFGAMVPPDLVPHGTAV